MAGTSWQTQVFIVGLVGIGGYLLWTNKFPPFNSGGAFDQLLGLFPGRDVPEGTPPGEGSTLSDLLSGGLDDEQGQGAGGGMTPDGRPVGAGGMQTIPPFQSTIQSDPSATDFDIYTKYAQGLAQQFSGTGSPVAGSSSGPLVGGDANLGTTALPPGLFPGSQYPGGTPPTGQIPQFPGLGTGNTYPSIMPGQFPGPNPMSPYGPPMGGPMPMPMPGGMPYPPPPGPNMWPQFPGGPPPVYTPPTSFPGRKRNGWKNKKPKSVNDVWSLDVGNIHIGLDGIRIGDLINIGGGISSVFPRGINFNDMDSIENDTLSFVDKILKQTGVKSGLSNSQSSSIVSGGNISGLGNNFSSNLSKKIKDQMQGLKNNFASSGSSMTGSGNKANSMFGNNGMFGSGGMFGNMFSNYTERVNGKDDRNSLPDMYKLGLATRKNERRMLYGHRVGNF